MRDQIVPLLGHATTLQMAQPSKNKVSRLPTVLVDTSTISPVISFDFSLQGRISPFSLNIDVG